jgi:hypothetical protein
VYFTLSGNTNTLLIDNSINVWLQSKFYSIELDMVGGNAMITHTTDYIVGKG